MSWIRSFMMRSGFISLYTIEQLINHCDTEPLTCAERVEKYNSVSQWLRGSKLKSGIVTAAYAGDLFVLIG